MSDLADFLLARIAEDEADARRAMEGFTTGVWTRDGAIYAGLPADEVVHQAALRQTDTPIKQALGEMAVETLGDVLRMLALPYAGHPDFREEWRP